MRTLANLAPTIGAAVLFAGCGGSEQIGAPRAMPLSGGMATHADRGVMAGSKSKSLLYVATGDNVYVLVYPSGKLLGSLGVSANEVCADTAGDVFVPHVNGSDRIYEYSHGAYTPIQVLDDGDVPLGCAVDPKTGNLAVTNEASGAGDVAIYPNAQEPPQYYYDPNIGTFGLCGYDDSGNLFVDGTGSQNVIAELPKGGSKFHDYTLNGRLDDYDSIQWDGHQVTLSNATTRSIYRMKFSHVAKIAGTTRVHRWDSRYYGHWPYTQTLLHDGTFFAQSGTQATIGLWRYPKGGAPIETIGPFKSGDVQIWAVAISVAPSR